MIRFILMVLCICLTSELVEAQEHSDAKEREKSAYLKGRESEVAELFEEVIPSFVVIITY